MKIQIYSDSLALPREVPQKVFYEETYPAKLSTEHIVVQYSKGAGTIKEPAPFLLLTGRDSP